MGVNMVRLHSNFNDSVINVREICHNPEYHNLNIRCRGNVNIHSQAIHKILLEYVRGNCCSGWVV
jgi:hypothetical protein